MSNDSIEAQSSERRVDWLVAMRLSDAYEIPPILNEVKRARPTDHRSEEVKEADCEDQVIVFNFVNQSW